MESPELYAKFEKKGGFLRRDGPARAAGRYSNKKLCFTSTSLEPMARLLYELSLRPDCFWVKLDEKVGPHGMVRGRCFLVTDAAVGGFWNRYKVTDTVLCTIQDDDFTEQYRES